MSVSHGGGRTTQLLIGQARRMAALGDILGIGSEADFSDPMAVTLEVLDKVIDRIYESRDASDLWLAYVCLTGSFPGVGDMEKAIAFRDANSASRFRGWFIAASAGVAVWGGASESGVRIVADRPVVDVSSCARFDRHTGIQRVERETLPHWSRAHELELVAWTDRDGAYRSLSAREQARVLDWHSRAEHRLDDDHPGLIVVPRGTVIVLPEIASARQASRLVAAARWSGNQVTAIGYDVIPLTSPELLPRDTGTDFLDYLQVIRHASAVAGISRSATEEFRGYFTAVGDDRHYTRLATCELPTEVSELELDRPAPVDDLPLVLCVGSHEPRKNHGAVLYAAERLWREGHRFKLRFLGGGGWGTDFDVQARRLRRAGRALEVEKGVSDAELWGAYRGARFTVFPSIHEGFGLPVAESLAFGTPVITTGYGSTKEIAERGGCLMIDPRSDDDLYGAMRRLLSDDELLARLSREASAVTQRTWAQYADELWQVLVGAP